MNLVNEHRLVEAVDAKLADLAKRRAEFEAHVAPLAEADEKSDAEYRAAVDVALLKGGPMPTPPVRQIPEGTDVSLRHGFMLEQQLLSEERQRAVAAAYDDVLVQARGQAAKLVTAARPPLEDLLAAMSEIGELLSAVRDCRDAQNATNPDGRRQYHDFPMAVEEFVRIVATSGDPIEALDLAGNRQARSRNVGMVRGEVQQLIEDSDAGQRVRA